MTLETIICFVGLQVGVAASAAAIGDYVGAADATKLDGGEGESFVLLNLAW